MPSIDPDGANRSALTPAEKAELDGDVQSDNAPIIAGLHTIAEGATEAQMRAAAVEIAAANPQTAVLVPSATSVLIPVQPGAGNLVIVVDAEYLMKVALSRGLEDTFSLIGIVDIGPRRKRVWVGSRVRTNDASHVYQLTYAVGDKDNAGNIANLTATTTAQQGEIDQADTEIALLGNSARGLRDDVTPLQASVAALTALLPVVDNVRTVTGGLEIDFTDNTTSSVILSTGEGGPDVHATALRFGAINADTGLARLFIELSDDRPDIHADINIAPYVLKAIRDYTELNDLNFSDSLTPEQQDNILRKIGAQEAPDPIPAAAELQIEALTDTGQQSRLLTGEVAIVPRKRGHALSGNINITDGVRLRTSAVPDPRATLQIEIGGVLVDFTAELQSINAVGDVVNRDGVWDGCIPQRDRGQANLNDAADGSSFNALVHFNPYAPIVIWITLTGGAVRLSNSRDTKVLNAAGEVEARVAFGSGIQGTTNPDTGVVTYSTDVAVTSMTVEVPWVLPLKLSGETGGSINAGDGNGISGGAGVRSKVRETMSEPGFVHSLEAQIIMGNDPRGRAQLTVETTFAVMKSTDGGATFVTTGAELTLPVGSYGNIIIFNSQDFTVAKNDIVALAVLSPASGQSGIRAVVHGTIHIPRTSSVDLTVPRIRASDLANRLFTDPALGEVGDVSRIINPGPGGKEWGVGAITAAPASVVLGGEVHDLTRQVLGLAFATNIDVPDPAIYRSFKIYLSDHNSFSSLGNSDSPAIEFLSLELQSLVATEAGQLAGDNAALAFSVVAAGSHIITRIGHNAAGKIIVFIDSSVSKSANWGITILGIRELDSLNIHGDFNSLRRTNIPTTPGANPQNTFALTGLSVAADDTPRKFYLKIQSDTGTTHNKATELVAVDRDDLLGILPANRAQIGQTFNAVNSFAYPDQRDGLTLHIGVDTNDQLIISGVTRPLLVEMFEDRLRFVGNA